MPARRTPQPREPTRLDRLRIARDVLHERLTRETHEYVDENGDRHTCYAIDERALPSNAKAYAEILAQIAALESEAPAAPKTGTRSIDEIQASAKGRLRAVPGPGGR